MTLFLHSPHRPTLNAGCASDTIGLSMDERRKAQSADLGARARTTCRNSGWCMSLCSQMQVAWLSESQEDKTICHAHVYNDAWTYMLAHDLHTSTDMQPAIETQHLTRTDSMMCMHAWLQSCSKINQTLFIHRRTQSTRKGTQWLK